MPRALPLVGRRQPALGRLRASAPRHRRDDATEVRDHLDADDLRAADLPDPGPAGAALAPLTVDRHDHAIAPRCVRRPRRSGAPSLRQDRTPRSTAFPWTGRSPTSASRRDPRDAGISMQHHRDNLDMAHVLQAQAEAAAEDGIDLEPAVPSPTSRRPRRQVLAVGGRGCRSDGDGSSLRYTLHHLESYRGAPTDLDVVWLHYDELLGDLAGQMRKLADRLDIDVPEALWPTLIEAATLEHMRAQAEVTVPGSAPDQWRDPCPVLPQWDERAVARAPRRRRAAPVRRPSPLAGQPRSSSTGSTGRRCHDGDGGAAARGERGRQGRPCRWPTCGGWRPTSATTTWRPTSRAATSCSARRTAPRRSPRTWRRPSPRSVG